MSEKVDLRISLAEEDQEGIFKLKSARFLGIKSDDISSIRILKKSIDARKAPPVFNYKVEVFYQGEDLIDEKRVIEYRDVSKAKEVHIVGFGPAGMFAALRCIELGFKPIVFERGKKVQDRRRDIKAVNRDHIVNPESNYCFGEGGAGTYSDGKLYTKSTKRGDVRRIFEILIQHGATEQILIDAHPHIGTNNLPKIVQKIRETILDCGGEIYFESKVVDFDVHNGSIVGIKLADQKVFEVSRLILATGHSARDIFELLDKKEIAIKAKSFAMGVRIEHPQHIIDSIQYHCKGARHVSLPAAAYKIVEQVNNRGVYSFCMCPGGFIVPAATAKREVVVNGMSPSKRDSKFANSGIVVEIKAEEDLKKFEQFGELRGLEFQKSLELLAYNLGGRRQSAPAQRVTDFVKGELSADLNVTSYQPGLVSSPLHSLLPTHIGARLRKAFVAFGSKMKGYHTSEANIVGVESRTSSPVNIPREDDLHHPEVRGLFPCGEGAGYAGGIVSAAMDGERCAEAAIRGL